MYILVALLVLSLHNGLTAQPVISGKSWADIGMDAILECIPGNGTILQVRWRDSSFNNDDVLNASTIVRVVKASGDLINRDETHYGFDPNDPFYPLTIKQVTLDDEAKYWCEVYIAGFVHDKKEVRIRVPPATISLTYKNTIYADPADVEVIAGDGHQFSCETLGIKPNADFTWTLQSTPLYQGLPGTATPNSEDSRLNDSLSAVSVNVPESPAVQQLTCGATNRQDGNTDTEKDTSVTLQVKVPPISSKMTLQGTNSDGTLSVDEGLMSTITCVVMGTRPSADIKWFLDGVMQSGGTVSPPSADSDELYDTTGSWSITPTRNNHKDEVMCQASTPQSHGDPPNVTAVLNVNGAPDTPSITGDAQMTENVQTSLMCEADMGFPDDWSLHWFREDTAITPNPTTMPSQSGTRFMFSSTLDFTPIREYNGHTIKCGAQKNSMSGSQATLGPIDVQFCARSVSIMACVTATAGNSAVLRCVSGSSNPATTLTWLKDGMDQTNTSLQPVSDGSNGGIITTLDITTSVLTKDDNGSVFQCSVSNDAVTCGVDIDVTDSCTLNVQYTPEFTEVSVNPVTPVIEGGEVILTCTADANPKPSNFIIWEKEDSPSTVLSSVYSDGTSTLTLSDIQRDQAGNYRCKANNGIPSSNSDVFSESVIVKVHYEVNITNKEDNEMGAKNEQDANLSCKAVGNPAPVMMWFDPNNTVITSTRNPDKYTVEDTTSGGDDIYGFSVTSSLTIKRVNSEVDYGLYTCNSSNGIGQVDMLRVLLNGTRRPNRPTGVVMTDRTSSSIAVRWSAGYDGGETQWFHISHKKTAADSSETFSDRIDGEVTTYNVTGLESFTEYEIKVYAQNDVGKNTNPGSIVEYTRPESVKEKGIKIEFNKDEGKVKISELKDSGGCIQLEVKYVIEGGSSKWTECGDCIEADDEVVLAERCPQTGKRRRRAIGDVIEVQAKYCEGSDDSKLCSDPITPDAVKAPSEPPRGNIGIIAGGVVGGLFLIAIIGVLVVYLLRTSPPTHKPPYSDTSSIELAINNSGQVNEGLQSSVDDEPETPTTTWSVDQATKTAEEKPVKSSVKKWTKGASTNKAGEKPVKYSVRKSAKETTTNKADEKPGKSSVRKSGKESSIKVEKPLITKPKPSMKKPGLEGTKPDESPQKKRAPRPMSTTGQGGAETNAKPVERMVTDSGDTYAIVNKEKPRKPAPQNLPDVTNPDAVYAAVNKAPAKKPKKYVPPSKLEAESDYEDVKLPAQKEKPKIDDEEDDYANLEQCQSASGRTVDQDGLIYMEVGHLKAHPANQPPIQTEESTTYASIDFSQLAPPDVARN
ncbi:nephrin-like isoform X6 [Asterias amurensis]|uniref:nephrin-like isoform X6 n=1 Tax=Asterias amurensis TaxID=7602 RepID=UPI003AB81F0B